MANITNGTLCSGNETVSFLLCDRAIKDFLATKHSFSILEESNNTAVSASIFLIKNFVLCFGISNIESETVTSLVLKTLLNCSLIILTWNYILNFTILWTCFAALLCYTTRVLGIRGSAIFAFSVTTLCLAPIHYGVPSTLEYIIDVLYIVHVGFYIHRKFFGPFEAIIQHIFLVATIMFIFLAYGLDASDDKGLNFMFTGLFFLLSPLIFQAFIYRNLFLFLVIAFIQSYCVYEQFFIYHKLSANITSILEQSNSH